MKQRLTTYLLLLTLWVGCLTGLCSCTDDETMIAVIDSETEELLICCFVTDPVVSSNNLTRATIDALGTESERAIHTLDLLVFEGESCIRHMSTQRASDIAVGKTFTSSSSGSATWYVTNCVPKNYLSNANYTHVLIANLPNAGADLSGMSLTDVKQLLITNSTFDPYAEQTTGIPMIQILPASNLPYEGEETVRDEFVETQLNFTAMERTVAKVQVVTQEPYTNLISRYKLVNYLKDGYLYNDDVNPDFAFDKRCNDVAVRSFQNAFDQGRVTLDGFNPWDTNPTMQCINGFALYCYPNYWFDNEEYAETKEGMHKYQPILEERQTYLLVEAHYVESSSGVVSNKTYYYKIPINQRIPEWNDAYTNGDLISNSLCTQISNTVYELVDAGKTSVDELTDDEITTLYTGIETQLGASAYPVYTHSDGTALTDDEKVDLHRVVATLIFALAAEGIENNSDNLKNTIAPQIRTTIMNERVRIEAEAYCRIRRNHHYIVYVSFDHAGGETEDEAFYLATEPFYDVVLRPEF